jgi:8-oxo-dGTP pyrophosphatase MutT (NUDIX family)
MNQILNEKNSHCSYCGSFFLEKKWPRPCSTCYNISFANPIPISVTLVQLIDKGLFHREGLLMIKRANEPKIGEWAFPGGYIELGETWQEGAARELKEEVNLVVDPKDLKLLSVESATSGNFLFFNIYTKSIKLKDIDFKPYSEVSVIALGMNILTLLKSYFIK